MDVAERFEARTAVLTGAGSGIGRATTERLLREGATVVGVDVVADRLDALRAEQPTERLRTVDGDLVALDTIDRVLAAAGDRIDGLTNVATHIEAPFRSAAAERRIGPFLQLMVPPVAQADRLAAAWLLSDDAGDVSGAVLASDGGRAAI